MKKLLITLLALFLSFSAAAYAEEAEAQEASWEKDGFLVTEACAEEGAFTNCFLNNYACGSNGCFLKTEAGVDLNTPLVLYVHDDNKIYKLDTSKIPRSEFDEGVNRNAVHIAGEYDASSNVVVVTEFKAPPPPKKSFFKGCL
jgi:hypothetical protein